MNLPLQFTRPQLPNEPPAIVRAMAHEDVEWNRPLFRAPPLNVIPPLDDVAALAADVVRKGEPLPR
jgi:hypothetical protein